MIRRSPLLCLLLAGLALAPPLGADPLPDEDALACAGDEEEEEEKEEEENEVLDAPSGRRIQYRGKTEFDFEGVDVQGELVKPSMRMASPQSQRMSATPGGAQDADFMERLIEAGDVPPPESFTAEGILSEHDLPVAEDGHCEQLLCVVGQASRLERHERLLAQPDVDALLQLGFSSGLDASSWRRPALNLVVVVDRSGSMQGEPLATVKTALRLLVRRLEEGDQLALVAFELGVRLIRLRFLL